MYSGVYKIKCIIDGKIYIGSSMNIEKRWDTHIKSLRANKHRNPHLQNSFNKYGEKSFIFGIIEYCNLDDILIREQFYLDLYRPYDRYRGFNNCKKADRPTGYKHTAESRARMSEIRKVKIKEGLIKCNLPKNRKFKHSEETKEKIRKKRIGEKNPRYGIKEDYEHKLARMRNLLATPKWSTGLTKENNETLLKLSEKLKGRIPHNRIPHTLLEVETKKTWNSVSLTELSNISPLSISSLTRLKSGKASTNLTKKYILKW